MVVTLVFVHPLLTFPFLFCVAFLWIEYPTLRKSLLFSLLVYFIVLFIKKEYFPTNYDSAALESLKNFKKLFPNYFSLPSNKEFLLALVQKYYFLLLLFIGMIAYYFRTGQKIKLLLMVVFFFGYTLLINVSYPDGADTFYIENLYLPLSIFVIFPFVFDYKTSNKNRYFLFLIIMLCVRLVHIGLQHKPYTQRVNYLQDYLASTNNLEQKKLIVSEKYVDMDILKMSWATPYEFWLLSTITENESRSILVMGNPHELDWAKDKNKSFITIWGVFDYTELPSRYFHFNDSTYYDYKF